MFCLGMRSKINVDFVVDIIIFEHIESVYFVCHKIFVKEMVVSFLTLFVNKYTTCALFTKQPLFACNLTSKMIKYIQTKYSW